MSERFVNRRAVVTAYFAALFVINLAALVASLAHVFELDPLFVALCGFNVGWLYERLFMGHS